MLTLQLNVLGLNGAATGSSRTAGVNYVLSLMGEHQPLVVSLNEICYEQFVDIRGFASAAGWSYESGYRVAFRRLLVGDDSDGCRSRANPSTHGEYGNAVFVRHSHVGESYALYYSNQAGDGSRNMVCVDAAAFLYTFRGCSTHITIDPPTRHPQVAENAWILGSMNGVVFGAGDYNESRTLINGTPLDTDF